MVVYALSCLFYLRLSFAFGLAMAVSFWPYFDRLGHGLPRCRRLSGLASGIGLFVVGWIDRSSWANYYGGRASRPSSMTSSGC